MSEMTIKRVVCGAYAENAYLLWMQDRNDALLIDPGDDLTALRRAIADSGRRVAEIWLTHGHFDHMLAAEPIRQETGATVRIHPLDREMLASAPLSLFDPDVSALPFEPVAAFEPFPDVGMLDVCGFRFSLYHTPGHTPGGMCFHEVERKCLLTGDTLFVGGYGRTDFPGGSFSDLRHSLRMLLALPGDTVFYPGHGASATLASARGGLG